MVKHNIYWWNLENLFDVENSTDRSEFLGKVLKRELKGWDLNILTKKLDNISSIISKFNGSKGPDILGVCEVESKQVVKLLVAKIEKATSRKYGILHEESNDKRGIDTALIYDKEMYSNDGLVFTLRITKRNSTRDLLQFHMKTKLDNELILVLNHWPSRSGGVFESEPYRIMVAETLAYWTDRIHEEKGPNPSIVLMGDFNDNPSDRSMTSYLLGTNNKKSVSYARNNKYYNLMFDFMNKQIGTHVFGSELNILDQFLVSKSISSSSFKYPFTVDSCSIIDFPELVKGIYKTPIRFGRPSSKLNIKGYSDHLPIELVLKEKG